LYEEKSILRKTVMSNFDDAIVEEKDPELEGIEEIDEDDFDYKIRVGVGKIVYTILNIIRSPCRIMIDIGKGAVYGFRKMISKKFRIISNLTEAIKEHPDDVSLYMRRAEAYMKMKKLKSAIDDYTQIINMNPNNADAYEKRGAIYSVMGYREEADADYARARELL
jgi:tetratricopeptide (TPR) repeat protein